jgi:mono/diheme cytochrome c family protein
MTVETTPTTPGPGRRELARQRPPSVMIYTFLVLAVATWIPLVVFARARVTKTPETKIRIFQDMDTQPKLKTQLACEVFADGREMRPRIVDTVARGQLDLDDHYFRGFTRKQPNGPVTFFDTFPDQIKLTPAFLHRGQERFTIYCSPCHGLDGSGNGPVNARALELQEPKWVQPSNLTDATVRSRPTGHLYNTVNNGIRNMPGYGAQVPVEDRWAIVAYVRALQLSQGAPASALRPDQLNTLK